MKVNVKEVSHARAKCVHDARGLVDRADAEKRDMSPEEKEQFDALMEKVDDLAKEIEGSSDEENDDEPADEKPEEKNDDDERDDDKECNHLRQKYLDRLEKSLKASSGRSSRRYLNSDNAHEIRGSKRYAQAYNGWLRTGHVPAEFRDLSLGAVGSDTAGGYLVTPVKLADDIVIAINNLVFIRQMAKITKVVDAKSLGNPQLTADIQGITWGDEVTVSSADSTMAFGRRDLTPIMATNLIKVSYRELQASPQVESLVGERIALSFAYGEEQAYLTGDGSGHPLGVFTASSSGISTARDVTCTGASHTVTLDDVKNAVYSIPAQYQNAASFCWVMHRDVIKSLVKLKDGNGQYLWQVGGYTGGVEGRRSDTLDGIKVLQSEFAPNTFAMNDYIAVLGDYSYYRIAETMNMEIQRLDQLYAASGQIGFLARKFLDGSPVLEKAFARLKLS